ncbi:MAG: cob(I)yrinic acid a,c-diamide adenosyltransferase [Anaerolineae bacterium]|jgi:cob(I)alamin adenosyltransferase|nr:cob(I)yrinic acid a,c-diamide adenosyltransferase [Anaerolineae bacterium]MBT7072278.1 cob(I)yrinic acid a,c-diamide adenosyltransferase [Anaerolineae bacterium]MBT7326095.1 cob(I)yrinic acid a,c-diamide adenosyltransferase [Anaerolineae bacterium]
MSNFYTRKGDDGTTGLLGEGRLPKYHPRMEAIGALDETTATLGLARSLIQDAAIQPLLIQIQRDLYGLMAEVAATPENAAQFRSIDPARVEWLETQTDTLSAQVQMPKEFILPGETRGSGALSLARTVVRRAERRIAELLDAGELENQELLRYLNRLSSLCFVLELAENQFSKKETRKAKE